MMCNRNQWINRYYYDLTDSAGIYAEEGDFSPFYAIKNNFTFKDFITNAGGYIKADANIPTEVDTLFQDYIWPRFYDAVIGFVDMNPDATDEEIEAAQKLDQKSIIGRIWSWMNSSAEKYVYLIRTYAAQESKLMDTVKSGSQMLFNDTPQAGGNFTTDNYVSTATKTSSETELKTPMARLKEIRDDKENLYQA